MTNKNSYSSPQVFSFFSGSGLLDLAFEKVDFQVSFVNEFQSSFIEAYKFSRKKMRIKSPTYGFHCCSIEDFLSSENYELETATSKSRLSNESFGFIGGPPCPDFSVAGKNKGSLGQNGKLSRSYFELILKHEPDWFLFENVKGLYRTKKHKLFFDQMKDMISKKYHVSERLFNSLETGCPQDRDRIILFGAKKQSFINANIDWEKNLQYSSARIVKDFDWPDISPFIEHKDTLRPNSIPLKLTVQHWFEKNQVHLHPNYNDCFQPRAGLAKFKTILEGDVSKKSYKRLHRWRYSPTVAYGNNEVHLHPYIARRLNVAEALAIQTMPKNFSLPKDMTLTDKFKTIGNGVPFLLGKHIAAAIMLFLRESERKEPV